MITQGQAVNSEQEEFTAFLINILEPTDQQDFENKIASMSEDELKELYRQFKQAKNQKLTRMAKDGLKFDFLEKYRGKCPDGTEMFMSGGCVKCRDKKNKMTIKNQDGGNIKERFKKGPGDSDSVDNAKPNKKQVKAFKDCNGGKARKNCNGSKMKKRFQQGGGFRILEPTPQNNFQSLFSNMMNTKTSNRFQEGGVTSANNSDTEIDYTNPLAVSLSNPVSMRPTDVALALQQAQDAEASRNIPTGTSQNDDQNNNTPEWFKSLVKFISPLSESGSGKYAHPATMDVRTTAKTDPEQAKKLAIQYGLTDLPISGPLDALALGIPAAINMSKASRLIPKTKKLLDTYNTTRQKAANLEATAARETNRAVGRATNYGTIPYEKLNPYTDKRIYDNAYKYYNTQMNKYHDLMDQSKLMYKDYDNLSRELSNYLSNTNFVSDISAKTLPILQGVEASAKLGVDAYGNPISIKP